MKLAPQPIATPWTPEEALDVARKYGHVDQIAIAAQHDRLAATLIAYAGMRERIASALIVLDDEIECETASKNTRHALRLVRGVLDESR